MLRVIILIAILGSGFASASERFTTLTMSPESLGKIVGTNGLIAGTGFVVGSPFSIITCDHVVAVQPTFNFTFLNGAGAHVPVTLETVLRRYDLALLRVDSTNQLPALPYGDIRRVRPGDDVVYMGYHRLSRNFKVSKSVVSAIGVALNEGVSVDFIEFEGEGVPGYSGGPILNHKGEVVALMREAWNKRGVKGGFAIEPAMLSKEFYYPTTAPPITNVLGTNTISIRLDPK